MKTISRSILPFQEVKFFSPLRDKVDYVRLIMLAARQLLFNNEIMQHNNFPYLKLVVDKMSRLFFYKKEKYFSVAFPFFISDNENEVVEIVTNSGKSLGNKEISSVISILDNPQFQQTHSLIDYFIEPNSDDSSGLFLLEEIFHFEPSYIRYDFDKENEKGKFHPLNHFDINYSQYSTFKLGLSKSISPDYFEDIQNVKTECRYISD